MKRILFACILVSACDTTQVPDDTGVAEEAPAIDLSMCKMQDLSDRIGQPVADTRSLLPEGTRVLAPNSVATQDYRPTRANVYVDDKGTIMRIACG
ncbi:I78 family peptidase inhibitor [Falsiruegeria mediterranea]